jgi:hypothetical protein
MAKKIKTMKIADVFDRIFQEFPKAAESKSLSRSRPKSDLDWMEDTKGCLYVAYGPRGGRVLLTYNEKSNKVTISRRGGDVPMNPRLAR